MRAVCRRGYWSIWRNPAFDFSPFALQRHPHHCGLVTSAPERQARKQLYIYAGQRNKDYLSDFYLYDIASNTFKEICHDTSKHV